MFVKSFGVLFYIKKNRVGADGECPIYLRITVDKVSKTISTYRSYDPNYWNQATGRVIVKRNHPEEKGRALNAYLDTLQAKVFEAKHDLIESRKPVTAEAHQEPSARQDGQRGTAPFPSGNLSIPQ